MHPAERAANTFERAVYRVAAAEVAHERDGQPLPKAFKAACRAVGRASTAVFTSLPSLIDAVAPTLTPAQVAGAKSAAAKSQEIGDITDAVAMVRLLAPYLHRS